MMSDVDLGVKGGPDRRNVRILCFLKVLGSRRRGGSGREKGQIAEISRILCVFEGFGVKKAKRIWAQEGSDRGN